MERIVIVGASLAGARAAAVLREKGWSGDGVLIGAERQLPYNRPPLSKGYLRGADRFEDQLVNNAAFYQEHHIELRLGVRATAIDPLRKVVVVEHGDPVSYDRLLVATGGRNKPLPMAGAAPQGGFPLRPVADCDRNPGASPGAPPARVAGLGFLVSGGAAPVGNDVRGRGVVETARRRGRSRRGPSRAARACPRRGGRPSLSGHPPRQRRASRAGGRRGRVRRRKARRASSDQKGRDPPVRSGRRRHRNR